MADRSFTIELRVGESLAISGGVIVTLLEKSGQRARLAFIAPDHVKVTKGQKARAGVEQAKNGLTV